MSDTTITEAPAAPEAAAAPAVTETVAAPAVESADTETTTEGSADAPKYDYVPAKFLKEDGTPDLEKLAKSYSGLEKKLGTRSNVPAADVAEYEYDFGDLTVDETSASAFKDAALAKGFTKDQYAFVMEQYKDMVGKMTWSSERTEAALKESWGKDFDTNARAARAGFDEFAPSDANPHDPVWNHPQVMKLLARMGAELGEDSVSQRQSATSEVRMTEQEVHAILASKEYRSGDKDLHAKVTKWYQTRR